MTDQIDSDAVKAAMSAVQAADQFKTKKARTDYLEMLGCAAIHHMRAVGGDDYARGWLEHALSDLDRPPLLTQPREH